MNLFAIIASAASCFLLGGLWYSPMLFGKTWNREAGHGPKGPEGSHPAKVFAISIFYALIAAFAFAYVLGPTPEPAYAIKLGFVTGVGIVATSFGINYQFGNRSTLLWLIDAGYHIVQFLLFGLIMGVWH
jgi:hypothetical protein